MPVDELSGPESDRSPGFTTFWTYLVQGVAVLFAAVVRVFAGPRSNQPRRVQAARAAEAAVFITFRAHNECDLLRFFDGFAHPVRIGECLREVWPLDQPQVIRIELQPFLATEDEVKFSHVCYAAHETPIPARGIVTVRRYGLDWKITAIESQAMKSRHEELGP